VHDCWCALAHALRLGWFVPPSSNDEPMLDVDELSHYAQAANGRVRLVVPGALHVPDGQAWADSVTADGITAGRFSAGFYALLLADLGVSAEACLGHSSAATAQAFPAHNLATVNLHLPLLQQNALFNTTFFAVW
jgi:hypothetical protein